MLEDIAEHILQRRSQESSDPVIEDALSHFKAIPASDKLS